MRMIFIGRDNPFDRKFINELSKEHELLCCFFLESKLFSFSNVMKVLYQRARRYGYGRVINELSFRLLNRLYLNRPEKKLIGTKPEYFIAKTELSCPTYDEEDIDDRKCLEIIRNYSPDIIVSLCCHVIFKQEMYCIPKFGTFVFHEGITPEYRGLHSPLWALLKKDYEKVGYTFFKVNDEIDGGKIVVQGKYRLKHGESYRTWNWVGHNALIEGLDRIRKSLKDLEQNNGFEFIPAEERESRYYTWMTLTAFLEHRFRVKNRNDHAMRQ